MIPLTDRNPTRSFALFCALLIAINLAVFLYDTFHPVSIAVPVRLSDGRMALARDTMGELSYRFALIPAYVTGQRPPDTLPITPPPQGIPAWLTIFTSMFLHANWLHIGGNMLYLWIFGNNLEDVLGRVRFVLFYLLSGLGAALLHILSDPGSVTPTVGASGAVAGLMGGYLLLYPHARILSLVPLFGIISTLLEVPAILVIGFWFVVQILNSQLLGGGGMLTPEGGGVAYLAHIGGFLMGLLLIIVMRGRQRVADREA